MSSSRDVNRIHSAHDLSVERLDNTDIGFMIFSFLDAVITQLLQKLVKGLISLIYLKTYTPIVLQQHTPLCSAKRGWTTGLPKCCQDCKYVLQNQATKTQSSISGITWVTAASDRSLWPGWEVNPLPTAFLMLWLACKPRNPSRSLTYVGVSLN